MSKFCPFQAHKGDGNEVRAIESGLSCLILGKLIHGNIPLFHAGTGHIPSGARRRKHRGRFLIPIPQRARDPSAYAEVSSATHSGLGVVSEKNVPRTSTSGSDDSPGIRGHIRICTSASDKRRTRRPSAAVSASSPYRPSRQSSPVSLPSSSRDLELDPHLHPPPLPHPPQVCRCPLRRPFAVAWFQEIDGGPSLGALQGVLMHSRRRSLVSKTELTLVLLSGLVDPHGVILVCVPPVTGGFISEVRCLP
jgi:hypothetical protein